MLASPFTRPHQIGRMAGWQMAQNFSKTRDFGQHRPKRGAMGKGFFPGF
jgi:hypothetical protein